MTIKTFAQPTPRGNTNTRRAMTLIVGVGVLLLLITAFFAWQMSYLPAELDLSRTQMSQRGHFAVTYEPAGGTIPVGELQSWTLSVTTLQGRAIEGAHIEVDGDMPQHGHGLASQPQITQDLGEGRYLLEGLKFQMGGWWVIEATITDGNLTDTVRFNLQLE